MKILTDTELNSTNYLMIPNRMYLERNGNYIELRLRDTSAHYLDIALDKPNFDILIALLIEFNKG